MLTTAGAFLLETKASETEKRDLYVPGAGDFENPSFSGWELKKKLKSAICMSLRLWASKIHVFGGRASDLERRWGRGLQRLGTC